MPRKQISQTFNLAEVRIARHRGLRRITVYTFTLYNCDAADCTFTRHTNARAIACRAGQRDIRVRVHFGLPEPLRAVGFLLHILSHLVHQRHFQCPGLGEGGEWPGNKFRKRSILRRYGLRRTVD